MKEIAIKLVIDGNDVRSIEDLQNNFVVDDILICYKSGRLKKWLEGRNFTEESTELDKINSKDDFEIIKQLAKIFKIDANSIDECIKILEKEKELVKIMGSEKYSVEVAKKAIKKMVSIEDVEEIASIAKIASEKAKESAKTVESVMVEELPYGFKLRTSTSVGLEELKIVKRKTMESAEEALKVYEKANTLAEMMRLQVLKKL